jgi:hypothetical protein
VSTNWRRVSVGVAHDFADQASREAATDWARNKPVPPPVADVEKSADHPAGRSKAIDGAGSLHSGKQYVKARKPPV